MITALIPTGKAEIPSGASVREDLSGLLQAAAERLTSHHKLVSADQVSSLNPADAEMLLNLHNALRARIVREIVEDLSHGKTVEMNCRSLHPKPEERIVWSVDEYGLTDIAGQDKAGNDCYLDTAAEWLLRQRGTIHQAEYNGSFNL